MTKRSILFTVLLFFTASSYAQFDTSFAKKNLLHCADSLVIGFKTRDWNLYARYSYPAMIGSMGGVESFKTYIAGTLGRLPDSAWKKYEPGNILQIVKTAGDLQAIVELHSIVEWQQMRVTTTHHLVAESWDGGMFWTFFDSQNDPVASTFIKPDLSAQLVIPRKMEKVEEIRY